MLRHKRNINKDYYFHVLNRASSRLQLFDETVAYIDFCKILDRAILKYEMKILAYCIIPNHWHLIVKPTSGEQLSKFMAWLSAAHARRFHLKKNTIGHGPLYQGRFKCFAIESDYQLKIATRYVERNAVTANLVDDCKEWNWCSASANNKISILKESFQNHPDWPEYVNNPISESELKRWYRCVLGFNLRQIGNHLMRDLVKAA